MSSDHVSDILSDDIAEVENTLTRTTTTPCAPAATPRAPLKPRDANVRATPPPSQGKLSSEVLGHPPASQNVAILDRRQVPLCQFSTPASNHPVGRPTPRYQNAPSSSQPLPTPVTARMPPPSQYAPSFSQPTPSKWPKQAPIPSPALNASGHQIHTSASRSDQASLWRFPFGAHRGKTLLELPENYIAYLRVDQDMAESMPGFAAVLRLHDAGQPPVPPKPSQSSPPASQFSSQSVPSSSAPARIVEARPPGSQEMPPSTPLSHAEYRLDFGKHEGKTLAEVPDSYIEWVKCVGAVESRPALAVAVIKDERIRRQSIPARRHHVQLLRSSLSILGSMKGNFGSRYPVFV